MGLRGPLYLNGSRKRAQRSPRAGIRSLLWMVLLLPALWLGYREVKGYLTPPQAMLVLGGATEREDFAAQFARSHPDIPIWVSGGSNPEYTEGIFSDMGINATRLHIDRAAVDTVSNFTTLVDEFQARGIRSVYLITSDYHMRRARMIGEIVFGSRGIYLRSVAVPSHQEPESLPKALRDGARAILWLTTGHSGSALIRRIENH